MVLKDIELDGFIQERVETKEGSSRAVFVIHCGVTAAPDLSSLDIQHFLYHTFSVH